MNHAEFKIKLESIQDSIGEFEKQIAEKRHEALEMYLEQWGSFVGSYIEYAEENGTYTYMKVEEENVSPYLLGIELIGPYITTSERFFDDDEDEEGFDGPDSIAYNEWARIYVPYSTLGNFGASTISRISREKFQEAFKGWLGKAMKMFDI